VKYILIRKLFASAMVFVFPHENAFEYDENKLDD
jgi:hypothetical protein